LAGGPNNLKNILLLYSIKQATTIKKRS